ncbi:DUF2514 domain-containing protein [Pseudomonas fulva]|uniref:DUF2514 domain-containing protein n=1 Tax=Pseudomonas fulva TaxID=47880 RepID=A0A7S9Q9C5_9PSED|nr:DUF2514 domain-containing protein [Pseudomonas fulva]QPH44746.1 DUF2514 domain-containing protein [Pseudomonas fulva]QPH49821.1 DUF2514 domain-containing protein [Pseudomonas fulva]
MSPWVGLAVAVVLVTSHWGAYEHGRSVEQAQAGQVSAQRDTGDRLAEVLGERSARQQEHQRAQAQEEARAHGHEERSIANAGAVDADASGQRLRDDGANFAAAVSCPGTDTAAVARGQAATRAAMVLSDLLTRSVETNRELAKAYDESRIAGDQCRREYDGLAQAERREGALTDH